ncbi:hypothetical protein [Streptomyces sp900116325]|uniref:hypothetical protein n=1 Tax=Streptomyces sp. 900116325 TaxID=3154295 RepID=UPI0033BB813F
MTCADEVFGNSKAVGRPHLRRAGDGHDSSTSHQPGRLCADVAAEYVEDEDEADSADVFQRVVVEVDELVCAEASALCRWAVRPVPMTCAPASRAS